MTQIEVKSIDELSNRSAANGQAEVTVSSSFSSDSIIMSTSNPSSLSSDVGKSSNSRDHNSSLPLLAKQDKKSGPRNCLIKVKPGSKNILLDSAKGYQNKLNGPLVHAKPRYERSPSLSSDDNSSLLANETQLQRVAEWVESSVHADDKLQFENEVPPIIKMERDDLIGRVHGTAKLDKDLITFETSSDEDRSICEKAANGEPEYHVKITKEMEENYLKLAASLDPVALDLASSTGPDLTIEKYRMDYKRLCHHKSKTDSNA